MTQLEVTAIRPIDARRWMRFNTGCGRSLDVFSAGKSTGHSE